MLCGACCDGDEVMLCVNVDKLAQGVAKEHWDRTKECQFIQTDDGGWNSWS